MKAQFVKGSTSVILTVFIQDSSSTTGAGLGSLIHTSSIVGGYVRQGGTGVALAVDEDVTTEGTYQAPSAAGKVRIGTPANMRTGIYELHLHNDLLATGANMVTISLGGASNMADLILEIQLTGVDLNDAVAGGMTTLADWTNAGRLDTLLDAIPTTAMRGTDSAALASVCTEVRLATCTDWINGGRLDLLLDAIPTTAMRGTDSGALASVCTEARLATCTDWINGGRLDLLLDAIQTDLDNGTDGLGALKTLIDAIQTDLDNGTDGLGAIKTDTAATLVDTTEIGTAGAGLSNITLANDLSATMKASVNTEVDNALDTAISELSQGIPTATPTVRTALMLMYMPLRNKLVVQTSGTDALEIYNDAGTLICKKLLTDSSGDYNEAEMVSGA